MALRLQRRAAFGWPATAAPDANPTLGMAVHYEGGNTGIADWEHDRCVDHWQDTRAFHMSPSRGWLDIGYSFGVCPHFVLEGRGKDKAQAAQPGGNTTWYSCTFMTGPGEEPHPGQVENFRALRAWLMADDVARAIRPHSSFIATGCPGDVLRGLITDGTLFRAPTEENDMPTLDEIEARLANPDGKLVGAVAREILDRIAHSDGDLATHARERLAADVAHELLFNARFDLHDVSVPDPERVTIPIAIARVGQIVAGTRQPAGEPEPTPEPAS